MSTQTKTPQTLDRGLLTLKDATTWLSLKDDRVVMRLVREGKLTARRVGRRVFITSKSLEEFAGVTEK